jgi:fido (protein-threonine AMPylation protein)
MHGFAKVVGRIIKELDFMRTVNERVFDRPTKLYRTIELLTALFVEFLEIHPFTNGNGHMARLVVIAILGRFAVYPSSWSLHPRPQDPPYSELISRYRSGDQKPLEHFVLSCI